uniref:hypothetical protein n=1 Tax=Nonomuraea pusilla TaxID=46177 RepID=UPI0006E25A0D|nr:hypothetical protein [Nonomuraea pusilla]
MASSVAARLSLAALSAALFCAAAPAAHASGPDLRDCYDGRCSLTLSGPVSFPVSPRFGVTGLRISFTPQQVRVVGTGTNVVSQANLSRGSVGSVNGISVEVRSLSAFRAVLRLTPDL